MRRLLGALLGAILLVLCLPTPGGAQSSGIVSGQAARIEKSLMAACTAGQVLVKDTTKPYGVACADAGGGGTPASPDTSIQTNCSGSFCGDANLTFTATHFNVEPTNPTTAFLGWDLTTHAFIVQVPPPSMAGLVPVTHAGTGLAAGTYRYRLTLRTPSGETDGGSVSNAVTISAPSTDGQVTVPLPLSYAASPFLWSDYPDASHICRTKANGSTYFIVPALTDYLGYGDAEAVDDSDDSLLVTPCHATNTAIEPAFSVQGDGVFHLPNGAYNYAASVLPLSDEGNGSIYIEPVGKDTTGVDLNISGGYGGVSSGELRLHTNTGKDLRLQPNSDTFSNGVVVGQVDPGGTELLRVGGDLKMRDLTITDSTQVPNNSVLYRDASGRVGGFGVWDGTRFATASTGGLTLLSGGAAGSYTLAKSGVVMQDASGNEIWRLWGTDPDTADDYNSGNLYWGYHAGLAQPTDNVTAGYSNLGIGFEALLKVTLGAQNTALGYASSDNLTEGSRNLGIGSSTNAALTLGNDNTTLGAFAGASTTIGSQNTLVGAQANTAGGSAATLSNALALGYMTTVSASNRAVIGNNSVTDVYLGSESAAAKLHAAGLFGMGVSACPSGQTAAVTLGTNDTGAIVFTRGSCS